ncbi:MAG: hypothetical protein ACJ732_09060 [Rubrobacteraceae bacterium]
MNCARVSGAEAEHGGGSDGDLPVVKEDETPPEGTVKPIYSEDGRLRFRPENGDYEELVLRRRTCEFRGAWST